MRGPTFTLNLDGVEPWRSPEPWGSPMRRVQGRELRRWLAAMDDDEWQAAEVPSPAEQRAGEEELNRLNAPLQEAWQRSREAEQRRVHRRSVAAALGAAIARATAHRGRHRRAPGSSSPRRRGSRRAVGEPPGDADEPPGGRRQDDLSRTALFGGDGR